MWHVFPAPDPLRIQLNGPKGEPVDFTRTIVSHSVAELPPNRLELETRALETTVAVPGGARTIRLTEETGCCASTSPEGARALASALAEVVRHMFRLDEDLRFYAVVGRDVDLGWSTRGVGRILRAPTVFEDVVPYAAAHVMLTSLGATPGSCSTRGLARRTARSPAPVAL
jgi:3-methyladenine DNA glycosylase/8-oxoguanine DNA glycosylase